ncbi:MAG TPA: hypothetical protein VIK57_22855 [Streptosporangiaceae bacterium]
MSAPWWQGVAPAAARLSCDGREHQLRWAQGELRAPDHPDLEGEQILSVLAGRRTGRRARPWGRGRAGWPVAGRP